MGFGERDMIFFSSYKTWKKFLWGVWFFFLFLILINLFFYDNEKILWIHARYIAIFFLVIGSYPLYLWWSCHSRNYESILRPLVKDLSVALQEKFIEKNKDNYHYLKYSEPDSWMKYRYVTKAESIKVVQDVLGCSLKQNANNPDIYTAKCKIKNQLYTVEGYGGGGRIFDIRLQKDRTYCYISFVTRNLMDFKDKSEGKNAKYDSYCSVRPCIQISH
jgi:hypothetical protein